MKNKIFTLETNGFAAKATYGEDYSYERIGSLVNESFCEESVSKELREAVDNLVRIVIEENNLE